MELLYGAISLYLRAKAPSPDLRLNFISYKSYFDIIPRFTEKIKTYDIFRREIMKM